MQANFRQQAITLMPQTGYPSAWQLVTCLPCEYASESYSNLRVLRIIV